MLRARHVLVAALVLALAGCVGIPTSGGVNNGAVIDDQDFPEFVALPSDPVPGSTQEQILTDFMKAVSSPQNGYAIAKKFLTSDLASTWKPDASTIIRTGTEQVASVSDDTMTYSISSRASVNALGQYQEERDTTSQTLTFVFAKERGEWRISHAENGIVLTQSAFAVAFREQALYFFDPSFQYLVPDLRWFAARQTSSLNIVKALLAGPSAWLQQAVTTAFPDATSAVDLTTDSGGTVVDLSTEALSATPDERDRMRQQLVASLDSPNVSVTVGGLELNTSSTTGSRAVSVPFVDAAPLIGVGGTEFGLDGGTGVTAVSGLTPQVLAAGATSAALSSDKQSVAFRGTGGAVYVALVGSPSAVLLDDRPGLVAPSIDPFRFVWSAQASSATSIQVYGVDGSAPHELQSGLPADAAVVSMDVSRDGARLLLLLDTPTGPRFIVEGIVRQDNVPISLGEPLELPVAAGTPLDATWVDDHTVAALTTDGDGSGTVTAFEVGGKSSPLGSVQGATTIAGGNGGTDGLRVLSTDGALWRPRGSQGWVSTGISSSFLGTKQ